MQENLTDEQNKSPPYLVKMKNKNLVELLEKEKFIKSYLDKGDEICAYERPSTKEVIEDKLYLELKIT